MLDGLKNANSGFPDEIWYGIIRDVD